MYNGRTTRKIGIVEEGSQYIEGHDVFNSKILRNLADPSLDRVSYMITRYEYRPDLIAKDIYGGVEYTGLLMAQCRISVEGYVRGTVLRIIPKVTLDNIVRNL